ncbi:hypothetical protein KY331_03895 [Candidatus Woesearchaeota archaeon]|nr:hypothetical protein [Candidatus Woesearchaeota archaeon]
MELSIFLAKIIGVVYVVAGISVLFNSKFYKKVMPELIRNTSWIFTMSLMGLVVFFIWVLKHNVWQGWPILITLFGWIGLLKSLIFLLFPEWMERMSLAFLKWINIKAWWGGFGLLIGLLFSYFGWIA